MGQTVLNGSALQLLHDVERLRADVLREGAEQFNAWRPNIRRREFAPAALNLAHYLALRRRDVRPIQARLMTWGLSSLGRSESRVAPTLDSVVASLATVAHERGADLPPHPSPRRFFEGEARLRRAASQMLGPEPPGRRVRIMVTLPSTAATDDAIVRDFLVQGMDAARINCAHDDPAAWQQMIQQVHQASDELHRPCLVAMDLAGPKARVQELLNKTNTRVSVGDLILLRKDAPDAHTPTSIQIRCSLPEIVRSLAVGHRVFIDDGQTGTRVEHILPDGALLRVTRAPPKGSRIAAGKSINAPDTEFRLSPLTRKDLSDLDFIAAQADIVGYSFVQDVEDVLLLQDELVRRRAHLMPLILKIETARALAHLPDLIITAGSRQPVAVMIARGDLAVEIGYERLAEMQEEILWITEAASVPVIWATQVLEQFVKKGTPSRAEISDAAMGGRAECVMLNKGTYAAEAVGVLDDILSRMQTHQSKKTPQLRALRSWR